MTSVIDINMIVSPSQYSRDYISRRKKGKIENSPNTSTELTESDNVFVDMSSGQYF